MFGKEIFTVLPEHLKLIAEMYFTEWDCEFGAPAVDPKRPYGNSDVYGDMGEILGLKKEVQDEDYGDEFSDEQTDYMNKLHRETKTVLGIIVQNLSETDYLGTWEREQYGGKWERSK